MLKQSLSKYLPAALLFVALIVLWQVAAETLPIDNFILPAPTEVADSLVTDRSLLFNDSLVTLQEIFFGFLIAVAAGLGVAVVLHFSQTLRRAVYPLLIASQTVPVIVLAPILVIMFGFDIRPKLAIVALICFFPIAVNTLDGLRSTDPDFVKMMRTLDASRWSIFHRVEFPGSLPYAFSGAKIAATIAAIGAIFGEYVGADSGLGHLMVQATAQLQTARVFAAIVILSAFAIGLFGLVVLTERILAPWARKGDLR